MTKDKQIKTKLDSKAPRKKSINLKSKEEQKTTQREEPLPELKSQSTISFWSTSTISTESVVSNKYEEDESIKDISVILNEIEDFSSEEEEEDTKEEDSALHGSQTFAEMPDFFDNFKDLPDISSVSEDISIVMSVEQKKHKGPIATGDIGHFVDPITGLEIHSSSSMAENAIDSEQGSEKQSETLTESVDTLDHSELSILENIIDEENRGTLGETELIDIDTKDIYDIFYDYGLTKAEKTVDYIDWEAVAREHRAQLLKEEAKTFLCDLIHKVVEKAEHMNPETVLRQNLDKRKLIMEFAQKYQQYQCEMKESELWQRKISEFYKRKQSFRAIKADNVKNLAADKNKYQKTLLRIDKLLAKKSDIIQSSIANKSAILQELNECEIKANNRINAYENLVRRSLTKNRSEQMNFVIEQLIKKMNKFRKQISDIRLKMITKQHNHAVLSEKLAQLEDLGNGLTIRDYDHIHHETQTLDKKIEERNTDLKRLYVRSRRGVNILAHYKEKQSMIRDVIETQSLELENLLDERQILRHRIYCLKLQHNRIRQEIKSLSFNGGLVDKPLLMYDYDQTVELCNKKRDIVARLRVTLATIQQRISRLEKRLTADTLTSFLK